ncbi:HAMP domain-containing sensor histidine kinase [Phaeobacter sp. PT47_59]|uniref:sensor histidine kinase n=1 Tax=Phaeobacter sp. PT47_59 TaxID=3029979 RepID=UPI002380B648|nr:HAMP domain-containing sensor histidine kinase [Phaeobacter sp. PT47_59]MDE4174074.1 HAMP domain-containing sensor histidine kinase [Phaeobacter sp. PT47_59]
MPSPETQQIFQIAQSIAGQVGHDMLRRLVEALSAYLDTAFVAVTYGEGVPATHARALYALQDQEIVQDLRFQLDETPCARVYLGETVTIPCGVAELYPREGAVEGYIGIPLRDTEGQVAGHLAVFSHDTIVETELATAIAGIFAQRAEAELRRLAFEAERRAMIAELSDLNARLQRGFDRLRQENSQKTHLMGLIAHDLRNPLAAIISQAELGQARGAATAPDLTRISAGFDKILTGAERMSDLISATLERVRAEGDALWLSTHPVDPARLVDIAVAANRDEASRKDITLTFDSSGDSTIRVEADDTLLVSAIDNLICNAVKYTPCGGAVHVTMEQAADTLVIDVTDNGQGLTKDDLEHVFGRFRTLSATPTGGETATGLGLANVRQIMDAHNGTVSAESEGRDQGSRFRLTLPLKRP